MHCSLFFKNLENIFATWLTKKKICQAHWKFTATSEKFMGNNSSIIGIALGFFEIIDYCYRFSTERVIVLITFYK